MNAIADLDLSAAGELDLLTKYLGKDSTEQVRRIKTVNIKDPAIGLSMAWKTPRRNIWLTRGRRAGSVQQARGLSKSYNEGSTKTRDLADLLSELQAAKEDSYLAGLSYLDTSRGIKPIIEKLPYNMQEKWLYLGTRYKQEHLVSFPTFLRLVDFHHHGGQGARTDPSF